MTVLKPFSWSNFNVILKLLAVAHQLCYHYSLISILRFLSNELARLTIFSTVKVYMSYVVPVKGKVKILQNFVAFSEYMNFKRASLFNRDLRVVKLQVHESSKLALSERF